MFCTLATLLPPSAQNEPEREVSGDCHEASPVASDVRILPAHCVPSLRRNVPESVSAAVGAVIPIPIPVGLIKNRLTGVVLPTGVVCISKDVGMLVAVGVPTTFATTLTTLVSAPPVYAWKLRNPRNALAGGRVGVVMLPHLLITRKPALCVVLLCTYTFWN